MGVNLDMYAMEGSSVTESGCSPLAGLRLLCGGGGRAGRQYVQITHCLAFPCLQPAARMTGLKGEASNGLASR
jgi:hypothetical protein